MLAYVVIVHSLKKKISWNYQDMYFVMIKLFTTTTSDDDDDNDNMGNYSKVIAAIKITLVPTAVIFTKHHY